MPSGWQGNDVLVSLSLPANVPGWIRSRPFLLAGTLHWLNIHRRYPVLLPASVALLLIAGALLTLPIVGHVLEIVAQFPLTPFATLAVACTVSTTRRKTRVYASMVDSWLAPLAAPPSVVLRVLVAPALQLFLLLLAIAIPLVSGSLSWAGAVALWATVAGAFVVGSLVGWLTRKESAASGRDFHYVTIRAVRTNWARAPKLEPLSYWAVGQGHVMAKPKVTARALVFVLLALPMGTGGETAIAVAAGAWVLLYVVMLAVAAGRVAFKAARWLAPTTIRYPRFTAVLGYRVLLAQLWTLSWVVFLTYAAAMPGALRRALPLSVSCLVLSGVAIVVTCRVAMKSVRMRLL
jgi:hypothetical protein